MKKITLLLFMILLSSYSNAQCLRTTEFGNIVSNNSGNFQSLVSCAYSDAEYSVISGLISGGNYTFTGQVGSIFGEGAHIYLTVTDASNTVIQHGPSPLTVNAIASTTVRLHYSEDVACVGVASCRNSQVRYLTNCIIPSGLSSSSIGVNSAVLNWATPNPAPSDGYDYYLSTSSTAPSSTATPTGATAAGVTTVNATLLNAATQYYFWVRSKCGTTSTAWSSSSSFTTLCNPFTPSYTQNFATFVPSCWSTANAGTPATGPSGTAAGLWSADGFLNASFSGAIKVNLYSLNRIGWIISPILDLSAGNYRVKFDVGMTAWNATTAATMGSDDVVSLVISNDNGTTWTALQTFNATNTPSNTLNLITIPLTTYVSPTTKFAFYATDGTVDDTQDYDFFIDNFVVESIPSCAEPMAATLIDITSTGATATWTAPASVPAQGYEYYISTSNTPPTSTTVVSGTVATGTTFNLTGLNSGTIYYVWIRSNCGSDKSPWTNSTSFMTLCAPSTPSATVQDFSTYLPNCWSEAIGTLGTATTLTGTSSNWGTSVFGNVSNGTNFGAKVNLYGGSTTTPDTDWLVSNQIDLGSTTGQYRIKYKIAVTSYNGVVTQTTLGTHTVRVVVSTDGGTTWSTANVVKTYTGAATYSNTGQEEIVNLAAYSGIVKIGFLATTVGISPDIDFHIDDFVVESSLGTESFNLSKVKVYPNPVKNVLNISFSENISDVAVFNLVGQQVLSKKLNTTEAQVDMSNLPEGTYLVKVTVNNEVRTMKVVKE